MTVNLDSLSDQEVFAKTIYGEARGEQQIGQEAVACVVINRVKKGGWWGSDVRSVCLKPAQFSCWSSAPFNVKNLAAMLSATDQDPNYARCLAIAQSAIDGKLNDVTGGADSYERIGTNAFWARGLQPVKTINNHAFYITVR